MENHPKWNFKEFSAFLLIYAANADSIITEDEKKLILKKVDIETFQKIKAVFDMSSDIQVLEIIMSYKGIYFPTSERKNELMEMVRKEFLADGHFSQEEKALFLSLKRLL